MQFLPSALQRSFWMTSVMASVILMITMGIRQSMGLFVSPLNTATGLGIVSISFALAVGQFMWGAVQPFAGALADRYGPRPVLLGGLLMLSLGLSITPWVNTTFGLTLTLGIISAIGSGASSFSVLISAACQRLPAQSRGTAAGLINAGGSFGQFIFAPIIQRLIQTLGWINTCWSLALVTLLALPMVQRMDRQTSANAMAPAEPGGLTRALQQALKDRSYLLLHLGFFTCGFHIAFLVTHLPTEVNLCGLLPQVASWSLALIGLANIVGSLYTGFLINRLKSKNILVGMYASRAILILFHMAAHKTDLTFYIFSIGLGLTWLATVAPTAAIIGKLFGMRYLATLFGLTLLSHQIGGFLGAYMGGLMLEANGNYAIMWWMDIALSSMAALANVPIREAFVVQVQEVQKA
ncbi:MAG: MFS transporter [Betaproteobacteria bacterium]